MKYYTGAEVRLRKFKANAYLLRKQQEKKFNRVTNNILLVTFSVFVLSMSGIVIAVLPYVH